MSIIYNEQGEVIKPPPAREPTATVLAMGAINLSYGHIIPHTWYEYIKYTTEGGQEKVDLQAIIVLSDIIYWYRPTPIEDETTGIVTGYNRKFAADKLQRSYAQIAERFGISKRQAKRAVKQLVKLGLIVMEFRSVKTANTTLSNVLFLEPVPSAIARISNPDRESCSDTYSDTNVSDTPSLSGHTYTKITTKTKKGGLAAKPRPAAPSPANDSEPAKEEPASVKEPAPVPVQETDPDYTVTVYYKAKEKGVKALGKVTSGPWSIPCESCGVDITVTSLHEPTPCHCGCREYVLTDIRPAVQPRVTKHPAVAAYYLIVKARGVRFDSSAFEAEIAETVDDVPRWRQVVKEYIARDWNPNAVDKMLDYYRDDRLPGTRRKPGENDDGGTCDQYMNSGPAWERDIEAFLAFSEEEEKNRDKSD